MALETLVTAASNGTAGHEVLKTSNIVSQSSNHESLPGAFNKDISKTDNSSDTLPVLIESNHSHPGFIIDKDVSHQAVDREDSLGGLHDVLRIPTDHVRTGNHSFTASMVSTDLEDPFKSQLSKLACDQGSDLPTAMLAAWAIVLSRLSGQDSILLGFGSTFGTEALMIMSALNVDLSGEPDTFTLLKRVNRTLGAVYDHKRDADSSIELAKGEDNPSVLKASFYSHHGDHPQNLTDSDSLQCYLELHLVQDNGSVTMNIRYAAELYNKETIERYARYIITVLVNMATNKKQPVASFDIVSPAEKKLLLETWNSTDSAYPSQRCIHHLFEDQVQKTPVAIAIVQDKKVLTYLELNLLANRLASRLVELGIASGDNVALLFERSIELIATELAVLKVGAAYVLIDTTAPDDRQAFLVLDTGSKLLVTNKVTHVSNKVRASVLRVSADQESTKHNANANENPSYSRGTGHDTAFIMFTSGTTGVPKGVMVPHLAVLREVMNNRFVDIRPDDCVAFATNPTFSPSTFDVWSPLLNGARIIIVDEDTKLDANRLATALVRYQVTCIYMTAPLLVQYAPVIGKTLSQLRYLVSGGEQGQVKAYSALLEHGGPVRLINRYGSTEISCAVVYSATLATGQLDRVPIGRPASNRRAYVLDKTYNPVPIGAIGELYIGGPGIATGYLNHPDLTAKKFLSDPFSNIQGARMYRTGDLARFMPDGNLVCFGRNDDVVKIRAYRVELGEIQMRLLEHHLVRNAAVIAIGDENEKQLVAYVEADEQDLLVNMLQEFLSSMLPDYMIPASFVRLDMLPLTSRGKVDHRALPDPSSVPTITRDYVAPQGGVELALTEMWSELLKIPRVSRNDNFFRLGGHSIMAMRLMNSIASKFGPQIPISTFFASPILHAFAGIIGIHIDQGLPTPLSTPIALRDGPMTLSHAQQRLWFLAKIGDAAENYHINRTIRLRGPLDLGALKTALDTLYTRHESLRCVFPTVGGEASIHSLSASNGMPFEILDIQHGQDNKFHAREAALHEAIAPFDTERGPLIRAKLFIIAKDEHMFLITMHHIVSDGWSMGVMFRELNALYEAYSTNQPNPLNPLAIQYPDYAAWERQQFTPERLKDQVDYWRDNLSGAPVSIDLPFDRPRPLQQSFAGASVPIRFDSKLTRQLKILSQKHGMTMFMTVLAAWSAVLSRLSGQHDVVIGTPSANRNHSQVEQLIGFFISTLAIRIDLSDNPSTKQLLERVRKATISAQAHQDVPFEQVVEAVRSPRRTDITPVFQVMLAWQNNDLDTLELKNVESTVEDIQHNVLKFDLDLELFDRNGEIVGGLNYSTSIFDRKTIKRHVGYLEAMLQWIVAEEQMSINLAPILGVTERQLLLETWNTTGFPYPESTCIHHLFENQFRATPEAIAIVHDERSLTYRELNTRSNWIAWQLTEHGVKSGDYVMLMFNRSINLIACQIAVLKVGAAYVPIDTNSPVERQMYVAADCSAKVAITSMNKIVPNGIQATVLRLCEDQCSTETDLGNIVRSDACGNDTAYVMYTSGTTGRPKGVVTSHRAIVQLAFNNVFADFGPDDRVAFVNNPYFDPSTLDVWGPLLRGASIAIIDHDTYLDPHLFTKALESSQVTTLTMTNGIFHQHAFVIGSALSKLKYLLSGAEQGSIAAFGEVLRHNGPVRLINGYGPTEVTMMATAYPTSMDIVDMTRMPIGRPIANARTYVLDKHLNPVPIGVIGELYVSGPGIATEYLNLPELTAERFLPDPFVKVAGARMYNTGDLVRYLTDGNLVFLGRNDDQVKIRGFRVELGEIESRLTEHPHVHEAIVLATGEEGNDKRLIAYVVAAPHENLFQTLRQYISTIVPEYMIPSAFIRMDAFPLSNNGKIDRKALPSVNSKSFITSNYVPPTGELEVALAEIWADLLKVPRVGRHDNFFELGGHSLLAVRLMNRVSSLGVHISLSTVFSNPTLTTLAKAASSSVQYEAPHSQIIPVTRDGPLHLSFAQQRLWFLTQMDGLSEIYHVHHATRLHGSLICNALKKSMETIFSRHESLQSVFVVADGQPQIRVLSASKKLSVIAHDLRSETDKEAKAKRVLSKSIDSPFDLAEGPLIRATLVQLQDEEHVFLITMHHIVTDGWSMGVMFHELNTLYEAYSTNQPNPLAPLTIQYPDYAARQRQYLTQDNLMDQAEYWRNTLVDAPVCIQLPMDRLRPPHQSFAAASIPIHIDYDLTQGLKTLSQKHGVTMFITVLAAWSAVLSRLSGQDDIVIGIPSANRNHPQVEQLIGFFVGTLAIRIDLSDEPTVTQILERVRKATISAQAHQDIPFEKVVEVIQPPRRTDITPIFQVMLAWQNSDMQELRLRDIKSVYERQQCNVVKFDLDLALSEKDGEITGGLNYSTAIFDRETIERHVGYLEAMLRWVVADEQESINLAPILGAPERQLLLEAWNATDFPYPESACIHQLFENQVEMIPEAVAIVHDERSLTYRELNSQSNWIAQLLVENGVKPGDYVMLLFDRSIELVASQIAVLKVGAAYVPIDSNAPLERQAYIASDCGSAVILADMNSFVSTEIQVTVLRLASPHDITEDVRDHFKSHARSSQDTAYVMYTSGSTGRPKGVMVPHCGIARLVLNNGYTEIAFDDCVGFMVNPSFDPSTFEVWSTLLHGARLVIIDKDIVLDAYLLEVLILRHQVTILVIPCAILHRYAFTIGRTLSTLKYLITGGEQASSDVFMKIARHGGTCKIINTYGPTETTVTATAYTDTIAVDQLKRIPIGRAAGNTCLYVLNSHMEPVPLGVVGELYIGGPGVANGYLNRPELTAERFLPEPFTKVPGTRIYKTGDLVRFLPDGNLVFLGRNDDQVKIRGFRVEIGEIESRLTEHPQVLEAVVLAVGEEGDEKRLVAYVVAEPRDDLILTVRQHLSDNLPEYMIPSAILRLDAFPLTNNGKINRRALPFPEESAFELQGHEKPEGKVETMLAEVWISLLQINRVSRNDNFFKLGGHSLMAVRMVEQLRQQGYVLRVRALFDNPILHVLAASLHQGVVEDRVPPNLITPSTAELTPDMLPLIDLNQDDIDTVVDQVPGGIANIQDMYSLSPLQDGILFHHMMQPEGDTYLLVVCSAFQDKDILDQYLVAFQKVVDRHDILRTAFIWKDLSTPAQAVLRKATLPVVEHSLDHANGPIAEQLMEMYNPRKYCIDLTIAPLTRFAYAQDIDGRWVTIQLLHHLIGDHSTLEVMREEIDAIMDGRVASLPLPQPYRNFVAQVRQGVSAEEHERFFKEMLHDIDSPTLPYGLSDVHGDGTNVSEFHCMLSQDLNNKLRGHAKRLGVSLASLCHLAWAQVVAATSGQSKVVFGTVLFGRMQGGAGSDRTLGLCINTLPIRVDVEGASVVESVRKVHSDLAGLLEHEHASLALANQCSAVPSGTTLFSSILNYRHNFAPSAREKKDIGVESMSGQERTNYPIDISVEDFESTLGLTAQIVRPYEPSRVCGYMEQALRSLEGALGQSPNTPIQSLNVIPAEEYDTVIHSWNDTDSLYPDNQCIDELFENQAAQTPDSIAVVHGDLSMTYSLLNKCASLLARKLIDVGVQPGDYVTIFLERSFELIIAQLAILKARAAYVPLDVNAPIDRQTFIVSDCGSTVMITDNSRDISILFQQTVVRVSAQQVCSEDANGYKTEAISWSSLNTAYVMYTSGSTGEPKGVMISHQGIAREVHNGYAEPTRDDCIGFASNPSFDPSTIDVWSALLHGARLLILDTNTVLDAPLLETAIVRHHVTSLFLTSALFHRHVFVIGHTLSNLKYLISGGEQAFVDAYKVMLQHGGPCKLINSYGPTETTVDATTFTVTSDMTNWDSIPIGKPVSNTKVYVLDKYCKPIPIGVVGELYVSGPGVAKGYLNRPDLTAERFLPDPFSKVQGTRMYKTGDLVRYLPDGNLVFIGRNDDQVKIRGYRVELAEIESLLVEHPHVREVVLVVGDTSDDKRLVAYIVAEPHENLVHTLRQHLSCTLPEYMIPSAIVRLDAFPLTNNGKIDRRVLPVPSNDSLATSDYVCPQGEFEVALAAVWSDVLKVERVGRRDNFFMLGGHSLLAVRLIKAIRAALGINVMLNVIFSTPTLSELALRLAGDSHNSDSTDNEYSVLIPLKPNGCRSPLFCIHPGPGLAWSYRGLAKHLHPDQQLYGLQARGLDGKSSMASSIEEMAVDYIQQIRKVQPYGPYYLLGWSFGGKVVLSMSTILQSQGDTIALLAIMDTIPVDSIQEQQVLKLDIKDLAGIRSIPEEQEQNGVHGDDTSNYDGHLSRLVGDSSLDDMLAMKRRVELVLVNNDKLAHVFQGSVHSGDILFFRSTEPAKGESIIDPECWAAYVSGRVEVHDVACAHVEMDKEEHIAAVGRIVAAKIEGMIRLNSFILKL